MENLEAAKLKSFEVCIIFEALNYESAKNAAKILKLVLEQQSNIRVHNYAVTDVK